MIYHADASALVKRYLNEIGSRWIRQLFLGVMNTRQIFIVSVTGAEMSSAKEYSHEKH